MSEGEKGEQIGLALLDTPANPEEPISVPEETKWEIQYNCCCKIDPCVKITTSENVVRHFWGSHELEIGMNIFVSFIILFVELVHYICVFPRYESLWFQIFSVLTNALFLVLFLWSYFGAAFMDPGFLPYNWLLTQKHRYTWQEQLTGLAIREDQVAFASNHKPGFASFSKSAGRFVVRADHICGWIGNWVGKRNHKLFVLMTFWGGVFATNLLLWHIPMVFTGLFDNGFIVIIIVLLEACLEIVFALLLFYVFGMNINDIRQDLTKIKKFKNEKGKDLTFGRALKEVFGNHCCCVWFFPVPAFDDDFQFDEASPAFQYAGVVD